ncbi:MAG: ABC transporter ATP-binding protein [Flavobacteriaceae bacterium]|nr:ABC transporter ATP-binding protein [Flavobacteriaceae bacterium]
MSEEVILKVEKVSKQYRLGIIGTGTLSHDLNRFFAKIRGKEDPFLKIGESNDRATKGNSEYVWALKDISFEVKRGEVLGIIGKNGAGKSTLLKILSKVTGPTTGAIKSRGRIASLLEVGTGFHPEMTGKENIFLNGAILGMTKKEIASKLDEIVSFSGCERYIETPVKRYSSGMKVRLAFAVAAFLEPDILVVDEVLAVGDAEFQKKAIGKMQDISNSEGRTVLFVSHNMGAVKSLCKTGVVLEHGKIMFTGSAEKAVNYYITSERKNSLSNLALRKDRIGSGEFKFVGITFKNKEGLEVNQFMSGDKVLVEIDYVKNPEFDASRIIMSVIFRDNLKQIAASFLSDELPGELQIDETSGKINLEIPNLYLRSERYEISLISFNRRAEMEDALDVIDDVTYINVLKADVFNVGNLNREGFYAIMPAKYYT